MTGPASPLGPIVEVTAARRPVQTVLHGRYCTLRPLDAARDSRVLYAATHGAEREALWAYLSTSPFDNAAAFDAAVAARASSTDPLFFAVEVEGEARGWLALMRITPEHRVIEVGHLLFSPRLRRTRAATEAVFLLARHVFEDLRYRRFEWKCDALNAASRRAALRLGFAFEGVFLQHMIVKGRSRDTAWYAMLDRDWPTCRAAFEAWLAPENFDAAGRQRETLAAWRERAIRA
jgi:RimJ/RimL family protein N-acetyltransferase